MKANRGLGKYIPVHFTADMLNEKEEDIPIKQLLEQKSRNLQAQQESGTKSTIAPGKDEEEEESLSLDYDYKKIGRDYKKDFVEAATLKDFELNQLIEQKLKVLRPKDFCMRQILKMCFYLQKLHELEVTSINCEFF